MRPPPSATRDRWTWVVALGLLLFAFVVHHARRDFIRSFFVDGPGGPPPALGDATGAGVDAVARLRVVLVDGLGLEHARALPNLERLCRQGLDLQVDVGFPTVSLPVQHVLWTGLTQQQSGVLYRIAPLSTPPEGSLARRTPDSVAVAESHPEIVHSFGFQSAWPTVERFASDEQAWRSEGFTGAATEAVTGAARLVFVHVLRVDEAGHAAGAASPAYAEAATWADHLLDALVRADLDRDARWVVLSDHGHRTGGGHGGAEPTIRIVRACVFGNVPADVPRTGSLHLVDLHRLMADSLGLHGDPQGAGRPFADAVADPRPHATLPRPSRWRWGLAIVWVLGGVVATAWAARGQRARLPWWLGVAYLGVVTLGGEATLSNPMIYPPLGKDVLLAGSPGLLVLAWTDLRAYDDERWPRRVVGHLGLALGFCFAALSLCGGEGPPLMPIWTAQASVLLLLLKSSAAITAALVLGRWCVRVSSRS